ncbi:MAG: type I-E CRISPR-associated protein Cse2/CasB [Sphaerochaetaceae bacterium]
MTEKSIAYINYLLGIENNSHISAAIRKGERPTTEMYSYQFLSQWCDITKPWEFRPYALVGASFLRSKNHHDGSLDIGKALALCYQNFDKDKPNSRLLGLCSCTNTEEACQKIRPILAFVVSKGVGVCYSQLLDDLLYFSDKTKRRWVAGFYAKKKEEE